MAIFSIYKEISAGGPAGKFCLAGDSAGAALCLSIAQMLRDEGLPMPGNIILLSPWLDISLQNLEIPLIEKLDPMLSSQDLRYRGRLFAGEMPLSDPLLSPLNADPFGLPPIAIFIGTNDIFLPDARKFASKCKGQGVSVNYFEYSEMFHDWMIFPIPEAKKAISDIARSVSE